MLLEPLGAIGAGLSAAPPSSHIVAESPLGTGGLSSFPLPDGERRQNLGPLMTSIGSMASQGTAASKGATASKGTAAGPSGASATSVIRIDKRLVKIESVRSETYFQSIELKSTWRYIIVVRKGLHHMMLCGSSVSDPINHPSFGVCLLWDID